MLAIAAVLLVTAPLAMAIVRTAWISDDAYITMRTIDNAVHGYGLRWNVAERVQSFTHPLWLLLLLPIVAVTGNAYLSNIGLSLLLTAYTVGVVIFLLRDSYLRLMLALTAMTLSKAFIDYATSGLENALSHAVLATLVLIARVPATSWRRALALGALVGAAGMTRLDLVLIAGPIALGSLRLGRRATLGFAVGCLPLAFWEIFSVIYYGVPFPNTAYAKLGAGIPQMELIAQGLVYLLDSLKRDPVTLFVIGVGIMTAIGPGSRRSRVAALAVVLYLIYVVRIGGDFMSGRFLTAPFLVALCLPDTTDARSAFVPRLAAIGLVVVLGVTSPTPTIYADSTYYAPLSDTVFAPSGVTDQRGEYFQRTGWRTASGWRRGPAVQDLIEKIDRVKAANPRAFGHDAIGLVGFYTGPDRYIIDVLGLADPFLSRLPATHPWRIGHYGRVIPDGFFESVFQERTQIADPEKASLYNLLRVVTRDPIWSTRRWRAIVALNTGRTNGWSAQ